jgi:hypothetical protein
MPRRSRKIARRVRTGDASSPSQRQAGDRWNRRLRTLLAKGRFVFRRSARVAAAVERILWRALDDGPAEPP